jgi:hypothetical protein
MESLKRIILVLAFFGLLFLGTLYLYPIDRGLAILFNLVCLGALSAYVAHGKQRSMIGWFFAGLFGGVLGLAAVLMVRPKVSAHEA